MANKIQINPAEYDWKLRLKLGAKRFLKGLLATLLIAGIQYAVQFVQTSTDLFPKESALAGILISGLLALEKALQKQK
jgi:hypothetical protein